MSPKYGPEATCTRVCAEHKELADALRHDRQGHRTLMCLLREGLGSLDQVRRMKEIEAHDIPGVGIHGVDRIMLAGAILRDGS